MKSRIPTRFGLPGAPWSALAAIVCTFVLVAGAAVLDASGAVAAAVPESRVGRQVLDDADRDADGIPNTVDNCPDAANPDQFDEDQDGLGQACDDDDNGDGIIDDINAGGGRPPVTLDDNATVTGGSLTVPAPGVLANDTDPLGGVLTAALLDGPAHGTVALAADGSFVYRPVAGYSGPDSFRYVARNINAVGLATVHLTVVGAPRAWHAVITLSGRTSIVIQCDVRAPTVSTVTRGVSRLAFAAAGGSPTCGFDALGSARGYVGILRVDGGPAAGRYGVVGQWSPATNTFTGQWAGPRSGSGSITIRLTPPG